MTCLRSNGQLKEEQFANGCRLFVERCRSFNANSNNPISVRMVPLGQQPRAVRSNAASTDGNCLSSSFSRCYLVIQEKWSIIYSIEYKVPMLYRTDNWLNSKDGPLYVDVHPVTGVPSTVVHPCQTAAVMAESLQAADTGFTDDQYLQWYFGLWLSLYGNMLGLAIPVGV